MSIAKYVSIVASFFGDGVSTAFTLDLRNDPYVIGQILANASAKELAAATGVTSGGQTAFTVTLASGVLTFNFVNPPTASPSQVTVFLLFA